MAQGSIRLTVNGEVRAVPAGTTVTALLEQLGVATPVAVERNHEIVPRASHATAELADGDELELVDFVGGG